MARPAAGAGDVRAVARTEARFVSYRLNGQTQPESYESQTDVAGLLELRSRTTTFQLAYAPRLTFRYLNLDPRREILQVGRMSLAWRYRRTTLTLSEDASYGDNNFLSLTYAGPAAPNGAQPASPSQPAAAGNAQQVVGGATSLQYGSTTTRLVLTSLLTRTLSYSLRGLYSVSGGLDEPSRLTLPLQQTGSAELGFDKRLSRRDNLLAGLSVVNTAFSATSFYTAQRYWLITESQGIAHRWSRYAQTSAVAGVVGVSESASDNPYGPWRVYPFVDAATTYGFGRPSNRYDLQAHARFSPEVNRLTGTADGRGQFDMTAGWRHGDLLLQARLGAVSSIPTTQPGALSQLFLDCRAAYEITSEIRVEGGARATQQAVHASRIPVPLSSTVTVAFVAISVESPRARF